MKDYFRWLFNRRQWVSSGVTPLTSGRSCTSTNASSLRGTRSCTAGAKNILLNKIHPITPEELDTELDLLVGYGLTFKEAVGYIKEKVAAFKEREQEDEDKPWAKPT